MEVLNNDVLQRIFELSIKQDENGVYSIDSIVTLISLRNTCPRFRKVIDFSKWKINSIQVEKDDVKGVPLTRILAGDLTAQNPINRDIISSASLTPGKIINLASQYGILQISKVNFKLHKLDKGQQANFLADLSAYFEGKKF